METPNLAYIKNMSGGDKVFEDKIIAILKDEFPVERESYENSLKTADYKQASEVVHKLKHKISILGLEKSIVVVAKHENNLKIKDNTLAIEFKNVLDSIAAYLNQL